MRTGPAWRIGLLLLAGPAPGAGAAQAQILRSAPDCGGDAYSSAQVVENRPARRGPLTAVPDTLCADVAPRGAGAAPAIGDDPTFEDFGMRSRDGGRGSGDPYGERPPRFARP